MSTAEYSFVDWSQFLPTLLATCIGCMIAILLTTCYDKHKRKHEVDEALNRISAELENIKRELFSISNEKEPELCFYLSPLHTPSYTSLVYSNKLGLILNLDWIQKLRFSDNQNDSFLLLYEYIEEYNIWQNWRTTNKGIPTGERSFADIHIKELSERIMERVDIFSMKYHEYKGE